MPAFFEAGLRDGQMPLATEDADRMASVFRATLADLRVPVIPIRRSAESRFVFGYAQPRGISPAQVMARLHRNDRFGAFCFSDVSHSPDGPFDATSTNGSS